MFTPFAMERWQSTWENRVEYNLSESGVEPLSLESLLSFAPDSRDDVLATLVGYGQSNGTDELRAAIARLYDRPVQLDGITVTNGSAEANFLAVWELAGPGVDIAVLTPTYMQSVGLARTLGAKVTCIPLREELGWQPDPDELRRLVTPHTRLIVVTNPGNPTGAILGEEARDAIIDVAERQGCWILADEVYAGAELDGARTPSFLGRTQRVIATGSLSKAYGLPGLRIGWAATDPVMAERLWARSDYTTISPGALTDRLATLALSDAVRPHLLERTRGIIREGLDTLESWMHDVGGFHWHRPAAGAICYARYDRSIDSGELAERLRLEQSVLIVPGTQFDMGRYIRFSTGVHATYLQEALQRAERVIGRA